ncbi:hypothetical protein EYR40_004754 [Pleurotus pulmonarius]|nr:hypothetical protein EYR40_004754 [Pleurotus pulmonarius]
MSPSIIHASASTNGHINGHTNGSVSKNRRSTAGSEHALYMSALNLDAVGVHKGYEYTRSLNPNRAALERTLAALESGGPCTDFRLRFRHNGDCSPILGAWRTRLEVDFLDLENASDNEIIDAIRPNTKLIWIESPTNPTLRLIDIAKISRLAKSHPAQPLVLVDNTFLSPFYSSPLLLGADLVMHSMTKYINGHSDVLMGALILPASHRHLAVYEKLQFLQNASGAVPSPYDCWLAQRGAKTLHLRMKAHGENALQVARALQRSEHVEEVIYPG